jgi:integrase
MKIRHSAFIPGRTSCDVSIGCSPERFWETGVLDASVTAPRGCRVNRHLALMRAILRMARDEWQWIDKMPKIRLLPGEVERDRGLTREDADKVLAACAPHLAALATGCRAREIAGLEWNRVDLERQTAWLNQTKNERREAFR